MVSCASSRCHSQPLQMDSAVPACRAGSLSAQQPGGSIGATDTLTPRRWLMKEGGTRADHLRR